MGDVKVFNVMGEDVNIKDEYARNQIAVLNVKTKNPRRFVCIGDSYAQGSGSGRGWANKLSALYNIPLGGNFYIISRGGIGAATGQLLAEIQAGIPNVATPQTITDVVLCCGANDIGYPEETITAALKQCIDVLRDKFGNATIHVGDVAGTSDYTRIGAQYSRVQRAYSAAAVGNRVHWLANLEYVLHDYATINADTVHPNDLGYTRMANAIMQAIEGTYTCCYFQRERHAKSVTQNLNIEQSFFNASINNELAVFSSVRWLRTNGDIDITYGHNLAVCDVMDAEVGQSLIMGAQEGWNFSAVPCVAYVHQPNGYYMVHGVMMLSNGRLNFASFDPITSTSGGFAHCDQVSFAPFTMSMPSIMC